jgi:hypothetical protein
VQKKQISRINSGTRCEQIRGVIPCRSLVFPTREKFAWLESLDCDVPAVLIGWPCLTPGVLLGTRRVHCAVPHPPCRRTRSVIPLFTKYLRLRYPLERHRNLIFGYPSVNAAAPGVRHSAVNPPRLLLAVGVAASFANQSLCGHRD